MYFLLALKPFHNFKKQAFSEYSFENLKTSKVCNVIKRGLLKSFKVLANEVLSIRRHRGILKKKNTIDKLNAMITVSMDTEIQNLYDFLHFSHNQRNVKVMHA